MALKRYDLNIGKRMESIELPEEHVVQVIDGGSVSKITDIKQATLEAVRNPAFLRLPISNRLRGRQCAILSGHRH